MHTHFLAAVTLAEAEVEGARGHHGLPSPCAQWSVGDVIRHVVFTQLTEVEGREVPAHPADPLLPEFDAEEAQRQWAKLLPRLRAAADAGPPDALFFPALDLTIHAWDLRQARHRAGLAEPLELGGSTLAWLDGFRRTAPEEAIRSGVVFGPAQEPPPGASPTARFMAWTGRSVG